MQLSSFVNLILSSVTVFAQLSSIFILVLILSGTVRSLFPKLSVIIARKSLLFSFIAVLVAVIGSLTYSEILGYEPCKLCWIQRIFMYPQAILLGMALWKKDSSVVLYSIVLSVFGGAVALYHYITQIGWNPLNLPCGVVGYSASCAKIFVLNFGYITIPLMAFSAFSFVALSFVLRRKMKVLP